MTCRRILLSGVTLALGSSISIVTQTLEKFVKSNTISQILTSFFVMRLVVRDEKLAASKYVAQYIIGETSTLSSGSVV
jgi:hypothetical protein